MENLDEKLIILKDFLYSSGVPPYERILFIEGLSIRPDKSISVKRNELKSEENYSARFAKLLSSGHDWVNLAALGFIEECLVVNVGKSCNVHPGTVTSVNYSKPPEFLCIDKYDLNLFVELEN